jgi:ferredoxin
VIGSAPARTRVALRVRVDPVACDAYGFCAELLPERVTLDEWGYPVVDGTPLDRTLVELATRAAAECPRRAFLLEQVAADR